MTARITYVNTYASFSLFDSIVYEFKANLSFIVYEFSTITDPHVIVYCCPTYHVSILVAGMAFITEIYLFIFQWLHFPRMAYALYVLSNFEIIMNQILLFSS